MHLAVFQNINAFPSLLKKSRTTCYKNLCFFSVSIKLDITIRRSVNSANKAFNYVGVLKYLKYFEYFVLSK